MISKERVENPAKSTPSLHKTRQHQHEDLTSGKGMAQTFKADLWDFLCGRCALWVDTQRKADIRIGQMMGIPRLIAVMPFTKDTS